MSPTLKHKPTDGATRAAKQIERNPSFVHSTAELIDRETGVRELADILEKVIAEATCRSVMLHHQMLTYSCLQSSI